MSDSYLERRGEIETYFDRTAAAAWSEADLGRAGERHPRHGARGP